MDNNQSYHYSILFSSAFRIMRSRAYESLEKFGLIPTHWSLLGVVYDAGSGITVSDAATRLGVKIPQVTIMVDYLITKNLIERIANEADGRSKFLVPSEQGRKQIRIIEAELDKSLSPLLAGVSESQLKTFQAVLQRIVINDK